MDDAPYVGQTDPRALELIGAMKALEDAEELRGIRHVEADPVVAHADHRFVVLRAGDADFNPWTFGLPGVLHRIRDEIGENEAQHGPIAAHPRQRADVP